MELNIPEIISEVLDSIDDDDAIAPIPESVMSSLDGLYKNEHQQDLLRDLRKQQRNARREAQQLRREIRRTEDDNELEKLEKELDENNESLKQYKEQYRLANDSYRAERKMRQVKKTTDAINSVFSTICDYGQSLRALKKNEKFTLMIKGGVDSNGKKLTQVYIIDQKSLKKCTDSQQLKNDALHYSL